MQDYRAKEIEHNKWVYGSYFNHIKRTLCPMGDCLKKDDCQPLIIQDGTSDWNMPRGILCIDVDSNTVCKNTGMTDINSKPIFTKDIVKVKSDSTGEEKLYYIEFNNTKLHFGFFEVSNGNTFSLDELLEKELGDDLSIEIIGNTIDNPDLLTSKYLDTYIKDRKNNIDTPLTDEERLQVLTDLFNYKWVETSIVQKLFNVDFSTGFRLFDFSRTAEWWSIVGKTEEERNRNGQKVTTYFRLKKEENKDE